MKNTNVQEVYCTTREAAQMLGVSLRTVQLWVESGVLKAWKTDGGHRRLPMSAVNELIQQRMGKGQMPPPSSNLFNILVLEDDEDMVKLYQMTMEGWQIPIQVTFVSSVYEALIVIGRGQPDLLITDLKMPGVDGFEIVNLLRNDDALRNLDIVVVTALKREEIEEKGSLPADITVFTKPVSFDQLLGYIKACLAHRKISESSHVA
ncbi:response regulator [Parasulfuritortus cantonensis]|uniref:Response regulator n=1 Tax=Parasulfuritortus cantonensis TaxID=2528202 RepID=A0A4V2NWN4_9PROT|nr:response regulator [Parasulfuritortus cantonensis]TCJ17972.1 response regulator [Parasulfuritortus cantonensis]